MQNKNAIFCLPGKGYSYKFPFFIYEKFCCCKKNKIRSKKNLQSFREKIINLIVSYLKKYSVVEAYLFGSYIESPENAKDIDIGVILKNKEEFFELYTDLMKNLNYELDLIPLHENNMFKDLVKRDGLKIYG